jgi:hypothetical protein
MILILLYYTVNGADNSYSVFQKNNAHRLGLKVTLVPSHRVTIAAYFFR